MIEQEQQSELLCPVDFHGTQLIKVEADVLQSIEQITGKSFQSGKIAPGFKVINHHVHSLGFSRAGIIKSPRGNWVAYFAQRT